MTPEQQLLHDQQGIITAEAERHGYAGIARFIARLHDDIRDSFGELEDQAEKHQNDDEEKLTGLIAMQLRRLRYKAECEPNNRGHVDLKVRDTPFKRHWIAEAKIWKGVGWLVVGMQELLRRYLTGRQNDAGLLVYIFDANADGLIKKWQAELTARTKELKTLTAAPTTFPFELLSTHTHNSGRTVSVVHFGVDLHYDPPTPRGKKSGKATTKPKASRPKKPRANKRHSKSRKKSGASP